MKIQLCDACRFDSGWHYDDPDHPTRPHHEAAEAAEVAEREREAALTAVQDANRQAFLDAKRIIHDAALALPELSGNDVRHRMALAQIPGGVVGAAFANLNREATVITHTGRYIPSDDGPTHGHRIGVYRSLIFRDDVRSRAVAS